MSAENASRPDGESGFSLIEVMIAIVVLVFGIVAVANLMVVAAASNATANHATGAAAVAAEEMEVWKATRLNMITPTAVTLAPRILLNDGRRQDGRPVFTITTSIAPAGPPGPDGTPISRFITVEATASSSLFAPRTTARFTTFRTTND